MDALVIALIKRWTELWLGHGCSGDRSLLENERFCGLGMDERSNSLQRRQEALVQAKSKASAPHGGKGRTCTSSGPSCCEVRKSAQPRNLKKVQWFSPSKTPNVPKLLRLTALSGLWQHAKNARLQLDGRKDQAVVYHHLVLGALGAPSLRSASQGISQ